MPISTSPSPPPQAPRQDDDAYISRLCSAFPENRLSAVLSDQENLPALLGKNFLLKEEILNTKELADYHHFSHARRQKEWLCGRICAKLAVASYLRAADLPVTEIEISNDASGRPAVTRAGQTQMMNYPDISISHSGSTACALAADSYCGIDLQYPKDTLFRVLPKFCGTDERDLLRQGIPQEELNRLTLLWCAKEAARKALSPFFLAEFLATSLTAVRWSQEHCLICLHHPTLNSPLKVSALMYNNCGIAICILPAGELPCRNFQK